MPYSIIYGIIPLDFVRWRLQNKKFLTYSSIIGMGLVTQNTLSVRVIKKTSVSDDSLHIRRDVR